MVRKRASRKPSSAVRVQADWEPEALTLGLHLPSLTSSAAPRSWTMRTDGDDDAERPTGAQVLVIDLA